nr:peptide ABC transporter substrate-binding protein [Pseudomonas sp.]
MSAAPLPTPLLQIRDLSVQFPTRRGLLQALDAVSLDVKTGQTLAIVGPS